MITVGVRLEPSTKRAVTCLGDEAAQRFGEGARPGSSEIARLLLQHAVNDPGIRRQVKSALVQARLKR